MYGYDPLHIHDEISMFLAINTKMVMVKTHVYMKSKNQTGILPKWKSLFQNENSFMKTHLNQECVYMIYLSNPPTILSFTFYLKTKS